MYKPQLVWARYGPDNKYYLLLYVGDKDENKAICFDSKLITDGDAAKIRGACKAGIEDMSMFLDWIRRDMNYLFSRGYKEFNKHQLEIVNTFDVGE